MSSFTHGASKPAKKPSPGSPTFRSGWTIQPKMQGHQSYVPVNRSLDSGRKAEDAWIRKTTTPPTPPLTPPPCSMSPILPASSSGGGGEDKSKADRSKDRSKGASVATPQALAPRQRSFSPTAYATASPSPSPPPIANVLTNDEDSGAGVGDASLLSASFAVDVGVQLSITEGAEASFAVEGEGAAGAEGEGVAGVEGDEDATSQFAVCGAGAADKTRTVFALDSPRTLVGLKIADDGELSYFAKKGEGGEEGGGSPAVASSSREFRDAIAGLEVEGGAGAGGASFAIGKQLFSPVVRVRQQGKSDTEGDLKGDGKGTLAGRKKKGLRVSTRTARVVINQKHRIESWSGDEGEEGEEGGEGEEGREGEGGDDVVAGRVFSAAVSAESPEDTDVVLLAHNWEHGGADSAKFPALPAHVTSLPVDCDLHAELFCTTFSKKTLVNLLFALSSSTAVELIRLKASYPEHRIVNVIVSPADSDSVEAIEALGGTRATNIMGSDVRRIRKMVEAIEDIGVVSAAVMRV